MALENPRVKMTSINRELAAISEIEWDEPDARRQASAITEMLSNPTTAWDEGDEDWVQILSGAVAVCYVHVKRPLAMLLSEFEHVLRPAIDERVVVLVVEAWTERSLSADLTALQRAFPGHLLPDALPGRSVEAFSAEELWFATD
jgi:hypothetical protein